MDGDAEPLEGQDESMASSEHPQGLAMERATDLTAKTTERKGMEAEAALVTRLYRVLSRVNEAIVRFREPERLFQEVCRIAVEDGSFRAAQLGLIDKETGMLNCVARWGARKGIGTGDWIPGDSFSVFPMWMGTKAVGALSVASAEARVFEKDEISLLEELADSIAFAVEAMRKEEERKQAEEESIQSLAKLRRTMEGIIQAMAMTTEIRDPYTAGHQRRVSKLASAIARRMRLQEDEVEGIRMAGTIHDIGKISVPAEILAKPGRISESELNLIKTHPQVGKEILQGIEFPWPVADLVCQHHERLDGSGYPAGLSGKEILLGARVLAVADVVEAMASHRPYRPALGLKAAKQEISSQQGIYYDPDVVDACLAVLAQDGFSLQ